MNDLQIEYFLAAAENLSFTKTAHEKFVTQPAVSKQISALEAELEVELFVRGYKSTKLTDAGRMYFDYLSNHVHQLETLKKCIREDSNSVILTLRIGCGSGWTLTDILPGIVDCLKKRHGNICVLLENCAFNNIVAAVNEHEFDVGLTLGSDVVKMSTLDVCHLTEVPRVIVYSANHPLAQKENLQPVDFKNEYFLTPQVQRLAYLTDLVNSFCEPYHFTPKIQAVRNVESLMNSVVNGLGVAIVDYWTYQTIQDHCCCVALDSVHTISAVWRKNSTNPLIQDFLQALKSVLNHVE